MENDPEGFQRALLGLQSCADAWREIGWTGVKSRMDEAAKQILTDHREKAAEGRKELSSRTKHWVALCDDEKLAGVKGDAGLIRQYQEYINELTKQLRFAEVAFVEVYRAVSDAPDPAQAARGVLSETGAVTRWHEAEAECKHLRSTCTALEKELSEHVADSVVIQRLEDSLARCQEQAEVSIAEALAKRAAEHALERTDLLDEMRRKEDSLTTRLARVEEEREKQLRVSEDVQQELMKTQSRLAELTSGQDMCETMLANDLEAVSSQVAELTAEKMLLSKRVAESFSAQERAQLVEELGEQGKRAMLLEQMTAQLESSAAEEQSRRLQAEARVTALLESQASLRDALNDLRDQQRTTWRSGSHEGSHAESARLRSLLSEKDRGIAVLEDAVAQLKKDAAAERRCSGCDGSRGEAAAVKSPAAIDNCPQPEEAFRLSDLVSQDPPGSPQAIAVVVEQRDRLKQQVRRLEDSVAAAGQRAQSLLEENQRLRARSQAGDAFAVPPRHGHPGPAPGAAFDRLSLPVVRLALSHGPFRVGALAYVAFLHLLVFTLSYKLTHDIHERSALRYPHHGTAQF
ncbi:Protein CASP [Diplonema papillatum]|nr:Protein CASP [Diplonema papillatum]